MDALFDHDSPLREIVPGRFTRVSVQTPAGEMEARLSERGNWELRVRRDQETTWRLACTGDLDCGIVTAQPVAAVQEETINLGALMVDPAGQRATVKGKELHLTRKEFALLLVLAAQPDRVFSKEELLATVWGHTGTTHTRTLDSHASRLREQAAESRRPPGRTLGNDVAAGLGARREEKERRHQRDGQPPGHTGQLSDRVSHHSPLRVRTAGLRLEWGSSWSCSRSIQEEGSIRRPAPIRPTRYSFPSRPPPTPATARRRLRSRVWCVLRWR